MQKVERVYIVVFATPVDAYVQAYNEYQARSGGATIPTYEEMLANVFYKLPFAEVIEAVSIDDAGAIIAYWYMRQHPVEVVTYQRAPLCPDLPLDIMMPVATTKWFEYLLREQYGMVFAPQATATLKLETPRDKELFEDLEEYELPVTTKLIVYQNGNPIA